MEEAGFDMQQVERLHERCLEQLSTDAGSCGAQIGRRLQRTDNTADRISDAGATAAMIIPLTIVTNEETGSFEVLVKNNGRRRSLQGDGVAEVMHQFRCQCGSGFDISKCLPTCSESIHGYELLLTFNQSDIRVYVFANVRASVTILVRAVECGGQLIGRISFLFPSCNCRSCKLHAGLYSWAGAVSEGSYFGVRLANVCGKTNPCFCFAINAHYFNLNPQTT